VREDLEAAARLAIKAFAPPPSPAAAGAAGRAVKHQDSGASAASSAFFMPPPPAADVREGARGAGPQPASPRPPVDPARVGLGLRFRVWELGLGG
jgi:hypothetical protein